MFYAFDNSYGNGTRWAEDNSRIGRLQIFETRAERDAWVDADRFDGNYHREAITYREALPYLVNAAAMYSTESPAECRARGAAWMAAQVMRGDRKARELYGEI